MGNYEFSVSFEFHLGGRRIIENDNGNAAYDHYHRPKEDVGLMGCFELGKKWILERFN